MNNNKFFLYARKSTDVEDKQVRSIEDQIAELRAFAKQNNLNIFEEFIEKQSAKIPGRPIFNEMIKRIFDYCCSYIFIWQSKYLKIAKDTNLFLASRAVRGEPVFPYKAARSAAATVGQKDESLILEHLYNQIRTYFERN